MRHSHTLLVTGLIIVVASGGANAQATDTRAADSVVSHQLKDPTLRSAIRVATPTLNLTATNDDKTAKAQLEVGGVKGLSLGATLNAPIDKDASGGRTTIADRDGISHKASIETALRYHAWDVKFPNADVARRTCDSLAQAARASGTMVDPDNPLLCSTLSPLKAIGDYYRTATDFGMPWGVSIGAGYGHNNFKWTDPSTLKESKAEHENFKLEAAAGVFYSEIGLISVTYTRQRLFEGKPAVQLCVPQGTAGALTCSSKSIAAPTANDEDLVTGEIRRFFSRDVAASIAVTHNATAKETAVEVPIYFVPDSKGKLNGGIAAQWSTDERSLRFIAFIGTVFNTRF